MTIRPSPAEYQDCSQAASSPSTAREVPVVFPDQIDIRSVVLTGIFILLFFSILHYTRDLFLPIILAFLLSFLFAPVVRGLRRFRIPEALSAALVFLTVVGVVSLGIYQLSGPASDWIDKAPRRFQQIEAKLQGFIRSVEEVTEVTKQVENMATVGDEKTPKVKLQKSGLGQIVFMETQEFFVGTGVMFILLYFLLSSGDLFLRKLVKILPRLEDKRRAVEIVRQIEEDISVYLFTATMINVGLGTTIGLAMYLLGMPNPVLWGVMGGLLNFIPYFGALVGIFVVAFVALFTFDEIGQILWVPITYFGLNVFEAYLITPTVLGQRLTLNRVVIFIWLIFWGWLWGMPGVLISVPLLVTLKITCDRIEPLMPIGEFLSR